MKTTEKPDTISAMAESSHNGDSRLTVYIFGAGASVSAGYPTAATFAGVLEQFRDRLSADPSRKVEKLKRTISSTLEHLKQTGAQTIDELVGTLNDPGAVEDAKTATEALFLDLELRLAPQKLRDYANFLVRGCLSPGTAKVEDRLRADVRVLTFNYDRTLEIAFALLTKETAAGDDLQELSTCALGVKDLRPHYGKLNTGFQNGHGFKLSTGRFAFLKLHGSVGLKAQNEDYGFVHKQPFPVGTVLDDDSLWDGKGNLRVPSLIVFPHEKTGVFTSVQSKQAFEGYISEVESAAINVIGRARQVHICGYSVCNPEWSRFEEIVKHAQSDCQFTVHDKSLLPVSRLRPIVDPRKVFQVEEFFSDAW